MPCKSPVTAYYSKTVNKSGKRPLVFNRSDGFSDLSLQIPCGWCMGCRVDKKQDWANRLVHESKMHPHSWFVTCTYDDEHLPADGSLSKTDLQLFHKRLRNNLGAFRFYAVGEYGERSGRAHYHGAYFGLNLPPDLRLYKRNKEGHSLFVSKTLSEIWGKGHVVVAVLNSTTASYVTDYVTKKMVGELAPSFYQRVHPVTGAIYQIQPEFSLMSRRPGIGLYWYDKFSSDAFPSDFIVINGKKVSVPKYYRLKLKADNPALYDKLQRLRVKRAADRLASDLANCNKHTVAGARVTAADRLRTSEEVLKARLLNRSRKAI